MSGYYQSFGSWNRTFVSLQGAVTTCLCCDAASSNCGSMGSLLADFGGVATCAEAVQLLADELKRRLNAPYVSVQSGSATAFIITLRLSNSGSDTATVQVQAGTSCVYPIGVKWSRPKRFSSGLSSFSSRQSLVDYLVQQLRR